MNFTVDGLNGYFGGKGASGGPQQLVNIIPPHSTLIIPFLDHCALLRSIRLPAQVLAFEKDREVWEAWMHFAKTQKLPLKYNPGRMIFPSQEREYPFFEFQYQGCTITIYNGCSLNFLEKQQRIFHLAKPGTLFLYCDPPYMMEVRSGGDRYIHEFTNDDHIRFLNLVDIIGETKQYIAISHYANPLYNQELTGWNRITYMATIRNGTQREETVYFNYDPPSELHDYSFFGDNYRKREDYKRKKKRMVAKWERMSDQERSYYQNALSEAGLLNS